ncbi:EamA family transporter, partial [Streptomyces sparsogenes]
MTALAPLVWGTTYVVTTELLPPGHPLFAGLL